MLSISKFLGLLLLFTTTTFSQKKKSHIVPFVPKFRVENLKSFISKSNIFYFENAQGEFIMNQGLKNHTIIKGEKRNTHYNAYLSLDESKILVEKDDNYLTTLNLRKRNSIYLVQVGEKSATYIGSGTSPRFISDKWVSYFDPVDSRLHLKDIKTNQSFKVLPIQRSHNPYFTPELAATSKKILFYTQLTSDGFQELIQVDLTNNTRKRIISTENESQTISLCDTKDHVITKVSTFFRSSSSNNISTIYRNTNKGLLKIFSTNEYIPGAILCYKNNVLFMSEAKNIKKVSQKVKILSFTSSKVTELGEISGEGSLFQVASEVLISTEGRILKIKI